MTDNLDTTIQSQRVSGREDVCAAYQRDFVADDYIDSRYRNDPLGRATHEQQVRLLRKIISAMGAKRVLEVAPGPARLTVHLPPVEYGCALEQSTAMLRVASERLSQFGRDDWQLQQGDAFDLPFNSQEFDAALCFKLVRHFDRTDRLRLLDNMRCAVRKGGHVILDVANEYAYRWLYAKWGIERGWIDDYWFTRDSFKEETRSAGFDQVRLYPVQSLIQAQYYCRLSLRRISPKLAEYISRIMASVQLGEPLEWIAVCRCA